MPYRIDVHRPPANALDLLVQMGALDIEPVNDGIAAILPDGVTQAMLAAVLDMADVTVSDAITRDDGSVWLLSARAVRIGSIQVASPAGTDPGDALILADSEAFGTGHHPTTALCIEALEELLRVERLDSILDVGTGSGILALAALMMGVPQALGLDTDPNALKAAEENARLNNLTGRLQLVLGGPDVVDGKWPLVVANVLAAPLIEMAPILVQRLGPRGWLILCGIHSSLEAEVRRTYQHFGLRHVNSKTRNGWTMLLAQATW